MSDGADDNGLKWGVVQACVWIATKREDLVALIVHPGSRHVPEGYFSGDSLEKVDTPTFAALAAESYDPNLYISGPALEALAGKCRKGRLIANGRKEGKGNDVEMGVGDWERITILDTSNGRPIRAAMPDGDMTAIWWSDLRFPAREVRLLWPDHGPREMAADDFGEKTPPHDGEASLVQSERADDQAAAKPTAPTPKNGAGNTPYLTDAALVARAQTAIAKGEQKSPLSAAWALAAEIPGHGSEESKVRRLAAKIRRADPLK